LALLGSNGRVVTGEELLEAVWGQTNVERGNVTSSISDLRKALGDSLKTPTYIETIPTRGYRWIGPITRVDKPASKSLAVVVLPLESLTTDPAEKYFAAGMTEALLAGLGKIEALKVIAYSGANGGQREPADLAHSVAAGFALTGSVLHKQEMLRITVHLLRAQTGEQIWAESYDGSLRDVFKLQTAVSQKIAEEIRVKLTPQDQARLAGLRKVMPAAYLEYLKGRYHWNRRTPEAFRKAMEHFQCSIRTDPAWAPPYAGLADAYLLLGSTSYDALPPREAMPKAKAAAASALKLDDSNVEAHASMAYSLMAFDWDFPAAAREFHRALELNPGYPTAHQWYAHYLLAMGKMDDAIAEMRKAWERDPLSLAINTGVGWALYLARRYDEAIEQYRKTLDMDDHFVVTRIVLGMCYERNAMKAQAIDEFQRALRIAPESTFALARLGQTYASSGNREEALRIMDQLTRLSKTRYVPSTYAGAIFAALGDNDQAFASASAAYQERSHYLIYLNVEPSLDSFRADPRFSDLACRIGLVR
jgi:TolB-like protein/Tfp pilus assembly protein PilF